MNKQEEIEFFLQCRLNNLIKTNEGYRFSCPFCGEGNSPWKRRCQLLTTKDHNTIYCFNCGISTSISVLLRHSYPYLFEQYKEKEKQLFIEDLRKGKLNKKIQDIKPQININTKLQHQFKLNPKYFKPAKEYKEAVEFCKRRKIEEHLDILTYCIHPKLPCSGMVIFPFLMEDRKTIYGFIGRKPDTKMFHLHSTNDGFKVFNLFQVDKSKPIVAVESQIDCLNLENSIAMLGADLSFNVREILKDCNLTLAFDNDRTGIKKTEKYIDMGYKVFLWPNSNCKDFNELRQEGWSKVRLMKFIKENTFKGLDAKTRIKLKIMRTKK